ncbi:MAG: hypothetical protein AAFR59_12580, partial [Bacteroidota bacterium]
MSDHILNSEQHEKLIALLTHAGQSLDSKVNSDHFLQALVDILPITHASVWVQSQRLADQYAGKVCNFYLVAQSEPLALMDTCIVEESSLIQTLRQQTYTTLTTSSSSYSFVNQEILLGEGVLILFRLNHFGLLKLFFQEQ